MHRSHMCKPRSSMVQVGEFAASFLEPMHQQTAYLTHPMGSDAMHAKAVGLQENWWDMPVLVRDHTAAVLCHLCLGCCVHLCAL